MATVENDRALKVYSYRWYIVIVFLLFSSIQAAIWTMWSPISNSAFCAFGLTSRDMYLFSNWPVFMPVLVMPFITWLMDAKGLRITVLTGITFVTVAAAMSCLPFNNHVLKYIFHSAHILNGVATTVSFIVPSLLSVTWFPLNERVTATTIAISATNVGEGLSMATGPYVTLSPSLTVVNKTSCLIPQHEKDVMRKDIKNILYVHFGIAAAVLLSMLVFFPSKPPTPPSKTGGMRRRSLKEGVLELCKNRSYLTTAISLSQLMGIGMGWGCILDVILTPYGVSQVTAGNIGFTMMFGGCALGVFIAWLADRFLGHTRIFILVLIFIGAVANLYLVVMLQGWIPIKFFQFNSAGLWTSTCAIGITNGALLGVGSEISAEIAYPTSEGTANSIFIWLLCAFESAYLILLTIYEGIGLANFVLLGSYFVALVIILFFTTEPVSRLKIDNNMSDNGKLQESHPLINSDY